MSYFEFFCQWFCFYSIIFMPKEIDSFDFIQLSFLSFISFIRKIARLDQHSTAIDTLIENIFIFFNWCKMHIMKINLMQWQEWNKLPRINCPLNDLFLSVSRGAGPWRLRQMGYLLIFALVCTLESRARLFKAVLS